MTERLIHEIRRKRPGMAAAADRGSRVAAIRLFCLECMGGSYREAKACESTDCPLWRYRPGQRVRRTPPTPPVP